MKKKFEPTEVQILDLHVDGYGTTEEPRFCVYGALPGEQVIAEPFTRRKRKIFARALDVQNPSPDRVIPPCDIALLCGGCSLQHLEPTRQIENKQAFLEDCLGDCRPEKMFEPITGPVVGYRAKARLGVRYVEKKEKVLVGFREKVNPFIAETESCKTLKLPVGGLLGALAELIESLSIFQHIPQIEVAVGDDCAALVFRHLEELQSEDINRLSAFGELHGVDMYLQPGNVASVHKLYPADSKDRLSYELPEFQLTMEFHPLDFTQINPAINRKMLSKALEYLELDENDMVLDAFCGIGNFSLPIATRSREVLGIEASETSVERARENASLNGLQNTQFLAADLFSEELDIPDFQNFSKVLLDPPRSGAEALCKKLASSQVEKVVYVSCNPVTLARDAEILVASGYQFEGAGVIDMFPHTTHVESIACFAKQ